jgi:hypothetical protein
MVGNTANPRGHQTLNIQEILSQVDNEIAKLAKVREALTGIPTKKSPGRPRLGAASKPIIKKRAKRKMSAEGRARIAAAQKTRWEKLKAKKTINAKPVAAKPVRKK